MKRWRPKLRKAEKNSAAPHADPNPQGQKFKLYVDEPKTQYFKDRRITIRGWLLPLEGRRIKALRIRNNETIIEVSYGLPRPDIAVAYPEENQQTAKRSGFLVDLEFSDGPILLEVDFGQGFEVIHEFLFTYIGGGFISLNYNPFLATNWANHKDMLQGKSLYYYEPEQEGAFKRTAQDPKLIACYLPQYHPLPENDRAWVKGFTEWHNVASAEPRFVGHHQPILPSDLGFYDLRLPEITEQQIDLAKKYGIYAFCYYYYWFSGQTLLDKPLNTFLSHKEWDFNFMICWANENWTKRWDGADDDMIIAQKYLPSDPLDFIKSIEHILLDPRYIKKNGKPLIAVYRPADLKDAKNYAKVWRQYFKEKHRKELHLLAFLSFNIDDPQTYGFDEGVEFAPQTINHHMPLFQDNPPNVDVANKLLDPNYAETVSDYRAITFNRPFLESSYDFPSYKCVMTSWDNDARRKGRGSVYYYSSPDLYGQWLESAIKFREKSKDNFVFINAWNEWGEGAILEPSAHFGHAMLTRTAEVLAKHSENKANLESFPAFTIKRTAGTRLAVVIHLYYVDQWGYIKDKLKNLSGIKFDLFVSLPFTEEEFSKDILQSYPAARVIIVPNRGRDVLPFMHIARRLDGAGYKALLKIHTKKSKHRDDGKLWFQDLIGKLLPVPELTKALAQTALSNDVMIGPSGHLISAKEYMPDNEERVAGITQSIYGKKTSQDTFSDLDSYAYFGGSMFWASMNVLRPLLDLHFMPEDFEPESGQENNTTAHAVERLFGIVCQLSGGRFEQSNGKTIKPITAKKSIHNYKYTR